MWTHVWFHVCICHRWLVYSCRRNAVIVSACRGKLTEQAPKRALGPLSDVFVPQKWFAHFYVVGCVCNGMVLIWVYRATFSPDAPLDTLGACMPICCFEVHLIRRLLETTLMMKYPKEARMHAVAYLFGLTYYVVVPLTYMTSPDALHLTYSPSTYVGVFVFVIGNAIQWHSHYILSRLSTQGRGRYIIPRDGLFNLVSCPHYFGEIVIYLGLAIMHMQGPLRAWYPLVWVIVNLALAARMTHQWYVSHFKTYPRQRKMLIPYMYWDMWYASTRS